MRLLAILTAIIQFSFAFHAVKTGRGAKWVMIIVLAPVVGCLAYYFIEVFPASREERKLRGVIRDIARAMDPDAELRRRTEAMQESDTVENRTALADECLGKGMFDEAIKLYEGCLVGPYANDARILFSHARARLYNGQAAQASDLLDRVVKADAKFRADEVQLLQARAREALGDTQAALALYEPLRTRYVGFEAKYRLAMLLKRQGREREARELFEFIVKNARRSALESEQQWVKLARAETETATA